MLDKPLLEFDEAFPDGCIVGNHGLSQAEIKKLSDETAQYIAMLKKQSSINIDKQQ